MGDPLSVVAAAAGLLTIATSSSKLIFGIARRVRSVPVECERVGRELDDFRGILSHLQLFLRGTLRPSRSWTSLVMVDQVVTLLTSCVSTFSDLGQFTKVLVGDGRQGTLDRVRWITKEKEINHILSRLQTGKASMDLMLTILICQNQEEAEAKVDWLCELMEQNLERKKFLSQRLAIYEPSTMSAPNPGVDMHEEALESRSAEAIGLTAPEAALTQRDIRTVASEELLNNSHVYRRAVSRGDDAESLLSTETRACNWSMLSGISLSEVSNVGILAIPIYTADIFNSDPYEFDMFQTREEDCTRPELDESKQKLNTLQNWKVGPANIILHFWSKLKLTCGYAEELTAHLAG